jgi:hypothetical protein
MEVRSDMARRRRPSISNLRTDLEELDDRPGPDDVLGIDAVLKYLNHVRDRRADAADPEEYFGRPVEWVDVLAEKDPAEVCPEIFESPNYRTPTPPDLYALCYCDEAMIEAVLYRLWNPDPNSDPHDSECSEGNA